MYTVYIICNITIEGNYSISALCRLPVACELLVGESDMPLVCLAQNADTGAGVKAKIIESIQLLAKRFYRYRQKSLSINPLISLNPQVAGTILGVKNGP